MRPRWETVTRRFVARHVFVVLCVGGLGAGDPLVAQETERAGTGVVLDLRAGGNIGDAFGHHEAVLRAEGVEHLRERRLQPDLKTLVVERLDLVRQRGQVLAERVLSRPAADRGGAVDRPHLLSVVPAEAVAQGEGPGELVGRDLVARAHLRLGVERGVDAVESVVDHVAVVGGDRGRGPDGVRVGEIGLRDEAKQVFGAVGRDRRPREPCRRHRCCTPGEYVPAFHAPVPSDGLSVSL